MTIEELKDLTMEQLEERSAEIAKETADADGEAIEALNAELDAIEARKMELKNEQIEARKAAENAVINGGGEEIAKPAEARKDEKPMEVRNSKEYINAFANYIKTGDDAECRSLLTENVSGGTVPVPEMVGERIKTAWEHDEIMARIPKSYLKGNVKVGFEISATGAVVHTEGGDAPAEETLTLGIVNMVPASIKKWITVSDEVMDMNGEAFLSYIYDELSHKIIKKAADQLVAAIVAAPAESSATAPGVPVVNAGVTATTMVQAEALLSDEAVNPVAIMNKQTWGAFKALTTTDGYPLANPFDGMPVLFNNSLPAYSAADDGAVYAIVGSLEHGARANFPAGEEVNFKFDDTSLAEKDLVKIVGRMFAAINVVAPNAFAKVTK